MEIASFEGGLAEFFFSEYRLAFASSCGTGTYVSLL